MAHSEVDGERRRRRSGCLESGDVGVLAVGTLLELRQERLQTLHLSTRVKQFFFSIAKSATGMDYGLLIVVGVVSIPHLGKIIQITYIIQMIQIM